MTDYPKEIYTSTGNGREITDPIARTDREKAYDLGKAHSESLEGWSNLTVAIQSGADIDWEKLDGIPAKCVHSDQDFLRYTLTLDKFADDLSQWSSWLHIDAYDANIYATSRNAWEGLYGWAFYIKGEIPLKTKTADQLKPGVAFKGRFPDMGTFKAIMIEDDGRLWALPLAYAPYRDPKKVEVIEEYGIGTFKAPEC